MKTELMTFKEDKFVNGKLTYVAGEVYEIEVETGSVTRWLKRGGTIVERGYDPGKQDDKIVDVVAGEEIKAPEVTEASEEDALAALGGEEEVVNEDVKKENKKVKKSSK